MTWTLHGTNAQEGDLVQLVGLRHKSFLLSLKAGAVFQTHRGVIKHDDLIGKPWGSQIFSHNGSPFFLLQPALGDVIRELPRSSQILYPKDIGYILVTMGIGPGQHVMEAGTGSGSMTTAFSFAVGKEGHVTSYEIRPDMQTRARRNLEQLGLDDRVTLKLRDIREGFDETGMDAFFLDVQYPHEYIPQVRAALKPGGFFGSIVPTTNQVIRLLTELRLNRFAFIDVVETILRFYKPEPLHFRPVDRMVAHTGYLVFGRPIIEDETQTSPDLLREIGLLGLEERDENSDDSEASPDLEE
ncbi:tRNA(1-methyladenosine) methyltransferase [Longilinea arvoryzae]|uniref:tRNA (adenine(58)-N(1))-methyltransferase TrmI n=1 Tax=Longilinea arvoryzae TaxID=360412 RepID=A0A0S7BKY6_9CHLR|nr:tRNA (adenine-N1)-methyltransferase [Longilinea arvoryzae]GAP14651.1 tRNA(1-methyladenosine) methyltransferase [Longilinea arvoryzae]